LAEAEGESKALDLRAIAQRNRCSGRAVLQPEGRRLGLPLSRTFSAHHPRSEFTLSRRIELTLFA